jgi:tRNA (guanine37-N1)-methyltransferase
MDIDPPTTHSHRSDVAEMFRPPVNRAMRVLDRSFFKKTVPVSAATIFNHKNISRVRNELIKSEDALVLPRLQPIIDFKKGDTVMKALLLREGIKHNGMRSGFPEYVA